MRCNICKQFCILSVQKLAANGVAVGEVCSFDGSENEACSSILNFLHWLNYRVRSAHEKRNELAFEGRESSRVSDVLGEIVPDVGAKM